MDVMKNIGGVELPEFLGRFSSPEDAAKAVPSKPVADASPKATPAKKSEPAATTKKTARRKPRNDGPSGGDSA